jgi:hypothetical protein
MAKLQELAARLARLEALQQTQRTQAVARALLQGGPDELVRR